MSEQSSDPAEDPATESAGEHPVGSLGEEAAKLLGVLAGWASTADADAAAGSGGESGESSIGGWASRLDEHLATGAPQCRVCPICRTVHVMRSAGPEVRVHLAAAAASLMQAAAGVLAAAAEGPPHAPPEHRPGPPSAAAERVQRIDLDEEDE